MDLLGISLHAITEQQCIEHILSSLERGIGGWVVTPNIDHLRRLVADHGFRELCTGASLRVADGAPLIWASRLQGRPLPERVAGSNLISSLSAGLARSGRSVFLLGGAPGTAEAAATRLQQRLPAIRIAGNMCPPLGFESDDAFMQELMETLRVADPDVVFVGLGSPKQELLIERLRHRHPRTWWLGIGVSFSFLSGDIKRAPRWLQAAGLEWLHRLSQEPRRLGKRYLVHGIPFATYLLVRSSMQRLRGNRPLDRPAVPCK